MRSSFQSTWGMFSCRGNIEQPSMFIYFYFHNKTNLSDFKKKDCANSLSHLLTLSLSHKGSVFLLYQCYVALRNRFCFFFVLFFNWWRLNAFQCALVTFADIYELNAFVFCDNCAIVCFSALNTFVFFLNVSCPDPWHRLTFIIQLLL